MANTVINLCLLYLYEQMAYGYCVTPACPTPLNSCPDFFDIPTNK